MYIDVNLVLDLKRQYRVEGQAPRGQLGNIGKLVAVDEFVNTQIDI